MNKIQIVGLGPGSVKYILPIVNEIIESADLLIGSKRSLELFCHKHCFYYNHNLSELIDYIKLHRSTYKICVVVTGDTGFYSLLDYVKRFFDEEDIEVTPGISSYQYMFSRLKKSYKAFELTSLHGRVENLEAIIKKNKKVFLLTDQINSPSSIANTLCKLGYEKKYMAIGVNLSYEDEMIQEGSVEDFVNWKCENLCVVVIDLEMVK